jgi:hypothetical protein
MKYTLMHKRIAVADLDISDISSSISRVQAVYRPEHLPVGVIVSGNPDLRSLNEWWKNRAIPASRSGLRDALEIMGISDASALLLKGFGLSLSDQYWVSPAGQALEWDRINFFENDFSEDVGNALFGRGEGKLNLMSPDNTSDGWLKKKWVIAKAIPGTGKKRLLVKGGSPPYHQEPLNEVLASAIMDRLKIPHVTYTLSWDEEAPFSICEDFITAETDLVSAWHIYNSQKKPNHLSAYQHFINCCETLGIPDITESLDRMLALDYLIANTDRHFNNFGALRQAETLEWLGAAPVFDCGTSMWHDQIPSMIRSEGKLPSKPFRLNHEDQIKLASSLDWIDFDSLRGIEEEWDENLKQSVYIDDERRDKLRRALMRRIELLGRR